MDTIPNDIAAKAVHASQAIYRVSEIALFDSVLKFELRKRSLEVITALAGLSLHVSSEEANARDRAVRTIVGLQELVRLSVDLGCVAFANAEKIRTAYDGIRAGISAVTTEPLPLDSEGTEPRHEGESRVHPPTQEATAGGSWRDGLRLREAEKLDASPGRVGRVRLNTRQDRILEYLSGNGQAQISHIRSLFGAEISEKTLQRDLVELVSFGLVRREGDNRWTTYVSIGH